MTWALEPGSDGDVPVRGDRGGLAHTSHARVRRVTFVGARSDDDSSAPESVSWSRLDPVAREVRLLRRDLRKLEVEEAGMWEELHQRVRTLHERHRERVSSFWDRVRALEGLLHSGPTTEEPEPDSPHGPVAKPGRL